MALSTGQIVGIVIAVVVGLIVLVVYIGRTYTLVTKTPEEAQQYLLEQSASSAKNWKAITTPFIIVIYFLPYFVAFYAIFNDIVTSTFSLSIGVIVGFALNLINLVLSKMFGSDIVPSDLCGLPGLTGLNSSLIPQAPLFVSAVTSYVATFVTLLHGTQSTPTYISWAVWAAFGLSQYYTLLQNRTTCLEPLLFGYGNWSPLLSIALGLGGGGASAYIVQKYYSPSGSPTAPVKSGGPIGSSTTPPDSSVGTCSPPNDQDQFVCETYKDGKLVTSTVASS